jgi:prepilin-type N-terminal cleavage/methylation domain-containing protein
MIAMKRNERGFTLIEVLAVIAIIGILASLLTPVVGSMLSRARKTRVMNNLRQISLAYSSYIHGDGKQSALNCSIKVSDWAAVLARYTGINDAALFIIPEDYLVATSTESVPKVVVTPGTSSAFPTEAFASFPLGITVITGIVPDANPATTPLAYTRGLDPETGQWKTSAGDDGGVYGSDGGFIVFLDGHVNYYASLGNSAASGELIRCDNGAPTNKIYEAVNNGARAINWKGVVWDLR